jgi:hypothetical protein
MQSPIRPSRGVLIWTVLAALALALFAGMSLLALVNGAPNLLLGEASPTPTPASPGDKPTGDVAASGAEGTPEPPIPEATTLPVNAPSDPAGMIGLWLSAMSAITALLGLASSLWLGWRKEGREMAQHQLELERARLEIHKLRQELAAAGGTDPLPGGDPHATAQRNAERKS